MSLPWLTVVVHRKNCRRSSTNAYSLWSPVPSPAASALQINDAYPRLGVLAGLFGKSEHNSQH